MYLEISLDLEEAKELWKQMWNCVLDSQTGIDQSGKVLDQEKTVSVQTGRGDKYVVCH
jgi:endo-1,4-beta-D-glucanase Y